MFKNDFEKEIAFAMSWDCVLCHRARLQSSIEIIRVCFVLSVLRLLCSLMVKYLPHISRPTKNNFALPQRVILRLTPFPFIITSSCDWYIVLLAFAVIGPVIGQCDF